MSEYVTSADSLAGTLWTGRERDACGTGFVARRDGVSTHEVVQLAVDAIEHLAHRGAIDDGADGEEPTGDGAGVLTAIPWALVERDVEAVSALRSESIELGLAMCFMPADLTLRQRAIESVEATVKVLGLHGVGWREVPVDASALGAAARATVPYIAQFVIARPTSTTATTIDFDALLYRVRRTIDRRTRRIGTGPYIASLSSRTVTYKGLLVADQLRRFFPDLSDEAFVSTFALFHQRYSTNTFPTWERAQPCRTIAHNGEINTLRGNIAWMQARGEHLGWPNAATGPDDDGSWLVPVIDEDGSDSAMLDDAVQLVMHSGRQLPEVLTMLVPPAWDHDQGVDHRVRDMLRAHSAMSEPWDGPAALAFADGRVAGACLDRNGLRPARWIERDDGLIACASEVGAVRVDGARIARAGRLGPGQMLVVDLASGAVRTGDEVSTAMAACADWGSLVARQQLDVDGSATPDADTHLPNADGDLGVPIAGLQALHGYSREELTVVIKPMLVTGTPTVGSMGDDTPIAALAPGDRSFFGFVRQSFAEVTNPPIDPLREQVSMSLDTMLGPRARLLSSIEAARPTVRLRSPIVTSAGVARVRDRAEDCGLAVVTIDIAWGRVGAADAPDARQTIEELCEQARRAVRDGADIIVLSDRAAHVASAPIPSLLAVAAVHQSLIRSKMRTRVGLLADVGDAREPHHIAALLGHGADAVCPWLALETARDLADGERSRLDVDGVGAQQRLITAFEYGLRTAMSRMGISTLDGYRGSHIFEVAGLNAAIADRHFAGTISRPGTVGWNWIADQSKSWARRARAWTAGAAADGASGEPRLDSPGFYKFRRGGERHAFEPAVVAALHAAVGTEDTAVAREHYDKFVHLVETRDPVDPRDLLELRPGVLDIAVDVDEVESAEAIVRRFSTGAMSHGSLSTEAHETLAEAMHLIGASSNSGEGGERFERYGTPRGSRIKQVASGRFGVTPSYLRSAEELQIKMAQGSKPGEGGQLPGHKVTEEIARIRHTAPGVSLISPPPHHDIYSIEDLAQLSWDLQSVHPTARISVKLVSQAGVGTIAAGVAKARAGTVVISGSNGGTGASPLGSVKYAGMPWEWGLAESQQVLVANRLRGRVRLRVDGGLRTGRDVLIGALLGADEFSFGTSALIAIGCTMARTCHNDKCPVGIATQDMKLRELFPGRPEHAAAYLMLVANHVRELLASIGARTLDEVVGRSDLLMMRSGFDAPHHRVDLTAMLAQPSVPASWPRRDHGEANRANGVDEALDARIAKSLRGTLDAESGSPAIMEFDVDNSDRTVGARVSGDIAEAFGPDGLEPGSVQLRLTGVAGQSLGAFGIRGLDIDLVGHANDFVGKSLAGAGVSLRFPAAAAELHDHPADNVIAGNACLYGATAGTLFAAGAVGERFAVRNSGASAVVEAAGDHLCEYMTGGTVVVLSSQVGRNIASGMSGGSLWVFDGGDALGQRLAHTASIHEPAAADLDELRDLVAAHAERTSSVTSRALLDQWPDAAKRFVLVRPTAA